MSKHLWKSAFLVVAFAVPVEGQEVTDYERFSTLHRMCATEGARAHQWRRGGGDRAHPESYPHDGRKPPPGRAFVERRA